MADVTAPVPAPTTPKPTNGSNGPQTPADGPKQPAAEAKPEDKVTAARFAALSKKERGVVERQQALKAREAELETKLARVLAHEEALKNAKLRPLEAAKAMGLTYEDFTNAQLNDGKPSPDLHVAAVRDELEAYKREVAAKEEKAAAEAKTREEEGRKRAMDAFRSDVTEFLKQHESEYELISIAQAHSVVASVIEREHAHSGKLLTTAEAAAKVETFLESQRSKLNAAKKYAAKQNPPLAPGDRQRIDSAQPRTLSNDMTASTASVTATVKSAADRRQRALEAMEKLKPH